MSDGERSITPKQVCESLIRQIIDNGGTVHLHRIQIVDDNHAVHRVEASLPNQVITLTIEQEVDTTSRYRIPVFSAEDQQQAFTIELQKVDYTELYKHYPRTHTLTR